MIEPSPTIVPSPLAKADFEDIAGAAIASGQTLPQMLIAACQRHGDKPAFTNLDRSLSFSELDRLGADLAAYLRGGLGLVAGDRVAIMVPNLLQFPVALLGVLRADLIAVLVNPMYTARELHHQLADSGARVLIVVDNFGHVAAEAVPGSDVTTVITTRVGDLLRWPKSLIVDYMIKRKKLISRSGSRARCAGPRRSPRARGCRASSRRRRNRQTVQLQYTGGTTGVSKGAALAHTALMANVAGAEQWLGRLLDPGKDISLICLPLYHIAAYANMLYMWTHGIHGVLVTNPRDIPGLVQAFKKYRPATYSGVNTLVRCAAQFPDFARLDVSHLKLCVQGGTALRRATAEQWKAVTGKDVVEMYGLSETSAGITANRWDAPNPVGSIGMPMPGVEISLRDEEGREVALGEIGELCVRGMQVTTGYWQREEDSETAFFPGGWFRTGDIAKADEQGYLYHARPAQGHDPGLGFQRVPE